MYMLIYLPVNYPGHIFSIFVYLFIFPLFLLILLLHFLAPSYLFVSCYSPWKLEAEELDLYLEQSQKHQLY